jgi:hypothetical protein
MVNILAWLETRSRWSKLRELGQSNLVRSSLHGAVLIYRNDRPEKKANLY